MRLVLMRHSTAADGSPDHSRKLAPEGRQQSKERGSDLAAYPFDLAIVSDAARTKETYDLLGLDIPEVTYDPEIYFGSHQDIVNKVRALPETTETVLILGHEPTISHAASILGQTSKRVHEVRAGVSTATAMVLDFERWDGPAEIVEIHR